MVMGDGDVLTQSRSFQQSETKNHINQVYHEGNITSSNVHMTSPSEQ